MASTINASTTGSGGLISTADASGVLQLQTAGTTAVTVGTDQTVTFAQAVNLPNTFGFKNRIINGAMVIDQRNAGASYTPTFAAPYTVDRFYGNISQTSKYTVQQNAGAVTPPAGFKNYLGVTSSSAYSVLAGDYFGVVQAIEGLNIIDLAWGTASAATITLSFWVRSSLTGTFGGALFNSALNRSYAFTYSISAANTWEQKAVTISGDTAGTWLTTNGIGISVNFDLGTGSTYSGAAGAWSGSLLLAPTGATSVVGTNGATFYITGVQLEKGSTATSFDYRPYGTELALCQRYFEKSFAQGTAPANGASATALSTTDNAIIGMAQNQLNAGATVFYKVTKRASPTVTLYGNSSGQWLYAAQSATSWTGSASGTPKNANDSSFIVDQQVVNATAIFVMGHYTSSAEL